MEERTKAPPERRPYEPPDIVFEQPTEALAGACDGTSNCPSKESGGICDSFQGCGSANS